MSRDHLDSREKCTASALQHKLAKLPQLDLPDFAFDWIVSFLTDTLVAKIVNTPGQFLNFAPFFLYRMPRQEFYYKTYRRHQNGQDKKK